MAIESLIREYQKYGHKNWDYRVNSYRLAAAKTGIKDKLTALVGDEDIAIVMSGIFEDDEAFSWINGIIPALDDQIPLELLKTPDGTMAVKALLMRLPK